MITVKMMQQLWAVIESTQVNILLQFNDSDLVKLLLNRFANQQTIDAQTANNLNTYIESRLPLIRDIAEERRSLGQGTH
jgi:succinate dehydrogenase flavin-adding protein (antitoxin of CptAB toxin-antitoxin module)